MPTNTRECDNMDRKIINVSKKRQITIPLNFYKELGLETEVECSLEDDAIVIRPLNRNNNEFAVEILKDLVAQGYSGDELIKRFETQTKNIKGAIGNILEEADKIANNKKNAVKFDDVFGSEN